MKKIIFLFITILTITSCQDVIQLDLNNADPKLVIDARLELNSDGSTTATVLLTRSAAFYQEIIDVVNNATITMTDGAGVVHNFALDSNGFYTNNTIIASPGETYVLNIIDGSNSYRATQEFVPTVPFTRVEQETVSGFGDDVIRITGFFNDPAGEPNFYLFSYEDPDEFEIDTGNDDFSDGNESITVFFNDELEPGTDIELTVRGLDSRGFQFYETLIQQTADGGGGPFDTQPATVRGNIVNTTDATNFAFGYFNVTQVFEISYTVVEQ